VSAVLSAAAFYPITEWLMDGALSQGVAEAGGSLADVVRTRAYLTTPDAFDGFARAHGEAFSEIRPANTTVIVSELVDPRWLLEIEVDAVLNARA
jgi:enamine deaminase RidA (YjgF/YER057c/UK114 family)